MGRQHRIAVWSVVTLGVLGLTGCGKSTDEQRAEIRRELLRADNLAQKRRDELEARRLTDDDGSLRPSTVQLGGITIPRGYEPKFVYDREWTYDGELPFHKLEQYFLQRLTATVEHPAGMITRFTQARPTGEPNALPVEVEVMPVPGRADWSRIHILQPRPGPEYPPKSAGEIAAELELKRRYAR